MVAVRNFTTRCRQISNTVALKLRAVFSTLSVDIITYGCRFSEIRHTMSMFGLDGGARRSNRAPLFFVRSCPSLTPRVMIYRVTELQGVSRFTPVVPRPFVVLWYAFLGKNNWRDLIWPAGHLSACFGGKTRSRRGRAQQEWVEICLLLCVLPPTPPVQLSAIIDVAQRGGAQNHFHMTLQIEEKLSLSDAHVVLLSSPISPQLVFTENFHRTSLVNWRKSDAFMNIYIWYLWICYSYSLYFLQFVHF